MLYLWCDREAYTSKKARLYITQEFSTEKTENCPFSYTTLGIKVIIRPFLIEAGKFFSHAKIILVSASNYQYITLYDLADNTLFMKEFHRKLGAKKESMHQILYFNCAYIQGKILPQEPMKKLIEKAIEKTLQLPACLSGG
ncbi:hypothetical protein [Vibrio mimicus]|uniref:hypothetical protein n=1 Tax=Vibrio mimicus TaxID=674 RepID=UPI0005B40BAB|nr:hypothetical protein [Vibrio mimicus]